MIQEIENWIEDWQFNLVVVCTTVQIARQLVRLPCLLPCRNVCQFAQDSFLISVRSIRLWKSYKNSLCKHYICLLVCIFTMRNLYMTDDDKMKSMHGSSYIKLCIKFVFFMHLLSLIWRSLVINKIVIPSALVSQFKWVEEEIVFCLLSLHALVVQARLSPIHFFLNCVVGTAKPINAYHYVKFNHSCMPNVHTLTNSSGIIS